MVQPDPEMDKHVNIRQYFDETNKFIEKVGVMDAQIVHVMWHCIAACTRPSVCPLPQHHPSTRERACTHKHARAHARTFAHSHTIA